jgi:hypothetical protein
LTFLQNYSRLSPKTAQHFFSHVEAVDCPKSQFKVMVFQAEGENITDYFTELWNGISTFQQGRAGEVYLLACYTNSGGGQFLIKKIETDSNGTPTAPKTYDRERRPQMARGSRVWRHAVGKCGCGLVKK